MSYTQAYQLNIFGGLIQFNLNPEHELIKLSERIDWEDITERLAKFYSLLGRRAKTARLLVGLCILKHMYDLSDEEVVSRLEGDLYFQVFCGTFGVAFSKTYKRTLHPTTLCKFRARVGEKGLALIEEAVRNDLIKRKLINTRTQIVDSTVMEKNVRYPTDARNLDEGRKRLVRSLKRLQKLGVPVNLKRTFSRKAKKLMVRDAKLGRVDGAERVKEVSKVLIRYGESILENADAALESVPPPGLSASTRKQVARIKKELWEDVHKMRRVIDQTRMKHKNIHVKNKLYSFHEPHVRAIGKGKLHKRFEFGISSTLSTDSNGYIVSHREYDQAIADVDTLDAAISDWKKTTGRLPDELAADRGYSRKQQSQLVQSIPRLAIPPLGPTQHPDQNKSYYRRLKKRRTAIEPTISHLKNDHRFNRSRYRGFKGDKVNATLSIIAWNLKKWAADKRKTA